jgi:hypothetical protein
LASSKTSGENATVFIRVQVTDRVPEIQGGSRQERNLGRSNQGAGDGNA